MIVAIKEFGTGYPEISATQIDDPKDLDLLKTIICIMEYQNIYYTKNNSHYADTLEKLLELKE